MLTAPPHLDVYYASTCAPCRLELPVVLHALADGTDIRLLIVSDPLRAKADFTTAGAALVRVARLAEGESPRDRLRRAGDADGILPFARSVGAKGRICAAWRGALTRLRIQALLSRCH